MNTYWPVRPRNSSMSVRTCSGVKATQSATESNSRSLISSRTDSGSRISARSMVTPGGSGRAARARRADDPAAPDKQNPELRHTPNARPGSMRRRVPGLVDGELGAVGQADRGHQAPALIGDVLADLGSLGAQFGERGVDVVAHQVELVAAFPVGGMNRQLSGRQGEDEPAAAGVYRGQSEHVREEVAHLLGFGREHDGMHPVDHA